LKRHDIVPALLCLAVLAVYFQVRSHAFLLIDDNYYFTDNPAVRAGLTWQGVRWALADTSQFLYWQPLTWLSLMVDVSLFGFRSGPVLLVNAAFHALNSVLLYLLLRRMTGERWKSALAAALFALHPLRVESVAWAAERKDLLSGLFFLLSLHAWHRYGIRGGAKPYLLSFGAFALSLAAKPMAVALPFVLLLLDWWPLGRFPASAPPLVPEAGSRPAPVRRLLSEKLPFLALSVLASAGTLIAQWGEQASETHALPDRAVNALLAYAGYLRQTAWPSGLAVFYPFDPSRFTPAAIGAAVLVLLAACAAAVALRRRAPALAAGWLWYLVLLVPVSGIPHAGVQSMTDHFTYLPSIGLLLGLVWGVGALLPERAFRGPLPALAAGAVLLALAAASWRQAGYWKDSATLFRRTLAVTSRNWFIHNTYGVVLSESGRVEEALGHYRESIRINPDYPEAHVNLAVDLAQLGRGDEAIGHLREGIRLDPDFPDAHRRLARLLEERGRLREAVENYRIAVSLRPDDAEARLGLSRAFAAMR
jgi:hypothetical protein